MNLSMYTERLEKMGQDLNEYESLYEKNLDLSKHCREKLGAIGKAKYYSDLANGYRVLANGARKRYEDMKKYCEMFTAP